MLKIKDNVNLKELEKFEFKAKYDEDTGKIKSYVYKNKRIEVRNRLIPFFHHYYDSGKISGTYYDGDIVEILYDLIQANLVERG